VRKPRVVQVTILTQTFDDLVDRSRGRPTPFEQTLSEFLDRTLPGREQLARPLKDALACFGGIEGLFFFFGRL
jgi:hypothetical protein